MILLDIDPAGSIPVYRQIFSQITELITSGSLPPGTKLPSTRALATSLGVSRSTVVVVYEELWAQGYLIRQPGAPSVVRRRKPSIQSEQIEKKSVIDWDNRASESARLAQTAFQKLWPQPSRSDPAGVIRFSSLAPDPRLFPCRLFNQNLSEALCHSPEEVHNYGPAEGLLPLRAFIVQRLQLHGLTVSEDEILMTNGSQQSLDLILRLLWKPEAEVIVEDPTYYMILPLLRHHRFTPVGIPMRPGGLDLDLLERRLETHLPALVYTTPNFQNPTGITSDHAHRERLLALCESRAIPLVEDAFEEEMKYLGRVPMPIKSMDHGDVVIYLGSFSKIFSPGIRLGWIAAHRDCIAGLKALKRLSDISSNSLTQVALAHFCRSGQYERYVRKIHRIYRKRMQVALSTLRAQLSLPHVSWNEPCGGFLIWLRIDQLDLTESDLLKHFLAEGVRVTPGSISFLRPQAPIHIRLSISSLNEAEIETGVMRLASVLRRLYASRATGMAQTT